MNLSSNNPTKDTGINTEKVQEEKKQKFMGRIKPNPGHTLFEFDHLTSVLKPAEFEEATAEDKTLSLVKCFEKGMKEVIGIKKPIPKRVIIRENCSYVSALNAVNAFKKLGINVDKK